jgi:nucleotidyltransferase substrate binding protein (TIGR01987 family)
VEKLIHRRQKFTASLEALERSIRVFSRPNIDQDIRENLVASIIKHFEMCYESAWKFLKVYLEIRYTAVVDSPKKVFRQCFSVGLINETTTKALLDIAEARNTTTHDYDQENAQEICKRISDYYTTFKRVLDIQDVCFK